MKKIKNIFDPIFMQNYWYIEAETFEKYQRICKKTWNIDIKPGETGEAGEVGEVRSVKLEKGKKEIILIWTKKGDLTTIVHECTHAVFYTLRQSGVKFDDSSEEVYSYLISFLFKEITSNKKDNKVTIRKDIYG